MYNRRSVIVVMPAGRRRYMSLVMKYIYQHKGLIDKLVLWVNTRVPDDHACLNALAAADPSFVHVQTADDGPLGNVGDMPAIRSFYTRDMDPQAIYLRIDDDICYMRQDAIPNLVRFRYDNPNYFCITANMVNSGLCSHIHNRLGLHHKDTVKIPWESAGGPLHNSAALATIIHDDFLRSIKEGTTDKWAPYERWELWEHPRFGIAVTAYWGNDLLDLQGKWEGVDDEEFFTCIWPAKIKRMNCICGKALVSHYAYGPQRAMGMDDSAVEVLPGLRPRDIYPRYEGIAP